MMVHSKKFIITILFTTPLFGMEYMKFKELVHESLEKVRTCNLEIIRTIHAEQLKKYPKEFLGEALKCSKTKEEEIISVYDKIIDPKGKKKFANHYNEVARKEHNEVAPEERNSSRNLFFEEVMYRKHKYYSKGVS